MSEYQNQKKNRPSIDALIERYLVGDRRAAAESFVAFLRENRMAPQWGAADSYNVSCKNRRVCIVKLGQNCWEIRANTQYDDAFDACFSDDSEFIRTLLLSAVPRCFGCGTCRPGLNRTILGRSFSGACFNPVIRLENPDADMLTLAKRLVLLRKKAIHDGRAPKITYIAEKRRNTI